MPDSYKSPAASYDAIPYPSAVKTVTHPCYLATLAYLHGLTPPALSGCRVLELGCASGGNLIPMAYFMPESQFIGVDISPKQIELGKETIRALDLKNIDLQVADLLKIDKSWGRFDYIIAHGIFSWVPPAVQQAILMICRDNLTTAGLAYISYNVYPGWHMRGIVRDFMTYHTQALSAPEERVGEALQGLEALQQLVTQTKAQNAERLAYELILKSGWLNNRQQPSAYVYHEFLEDENNPLYYYQFEELLKTYELRTITDVRFPLTTAVAEPPGLAPLLGYRPADKQVREQYLDFLHCRSFRRSLITHQAAEASDYLLPDRIKGLALAALVDTATEPAEPTGGAESVTFQLNNRQSQQLQPLTTDDPFVKALLTCLGAAWPEVISFQELSRRINSPLAREETEAALTERLAELFCRGLVDLYWQIPQFNAAICPQPRVSGLTLYQTSQGPVVTNPLHEDIDLSVDKLVTMLIPYLDGQTDKAALIQVVRGWLAQGVIKISLALEQDQAASQGEAELDELVTGLVERCLQRLHAARLLS